MPAIRTSTPAPRPVREIVSLPPTIPELPEEVFDRFPSLRTWQESANNFWTRVNVAMQGSTGEIAQVVSENRVDGQNLRITFNEFTAEITTEVEVIADELGAQAQRIVTVSAIAGLAQHIKVQAGAPGAPVLNDYWVNTTVPAQPVTYQWNGASWVEVTTQITAAAVSDERTARVTADGFLEGKYTLTVTAGNVVTGMNITSSTGAGANVSSVVFQADKFQIFNGTSGQAVFDLSGSSVRISGWTLNATTLTGGNATLDSSGQLILGTGNDVVFISASDAVYRVWVGNATAATATFSVTKAGALFSTSGTIGGWTIGTTNLSGTNIQLFANASSGINVGAAGAALTRMTYAAGIPVLAQTNAAGIVIAQLFPSGSDGRFELYDSLNNLRIQLLSTGTSNFVNGVTAASFGGAGSALTSLSASNISSGTLNTARLPSAITVSGDILSTGGSITAGVKLEATLVNCDTITMTTSLTSGVTTAATYMVLTNAATAAELKLGAQNAQHAITRRSNGGSINFYGFNVSNLIAAEMSVPVGTACGLFSLNDAAGNQVVGFDASVAGGAPKFGTYTAGALAVTGSIAITDAGGTTRRMLVG